MTASALAGFEFPPSPLRAVRDVAPFGLLSAARPNPARTLAKGPMVRPANSAMCRPNSPAQSVARPADHAP